MKIYTNDLVKGHSDFKVKCLTFGLYTQVSDSGPLGPLVCYSSLKMSTGILTFNFRDVLDAVRVSHACRAAIGLNFRFHFYITIILFYITIVF